MSFNILHGQSIHNVTFFLNSWMSLFLNVPTVQKHALTDLLDPFREKEKKKLNETKL